MAQPLHLTMEGPNPITMSEWLWISALISDMEGTKSSNHDRMAQPLYQTYSSEWLWISALISDMEGTESSHHDRMAQPLHLTMEGTNPLTMSKWLWVLSLSLGGNLDLENTNILPEVLEL